jgi:phosphoribosylaminoimidazolecarboxamide formyltransferase/IMP cyclohydrolase
VATDTGNGRWTRLRALLSVADRAGIAAFARQLRELDVEVYATDGTREHLAAEGVEVRPSPS